jgi:hypothetical protein
MRERAERLHQFCKTVDRRRAAGVPVRKAVTYFAWFWKDRPYRTAPHIKARLSRSTLVRLYYRWRRNGKSPDCFALHYVDRLPLVPLEIVHAFLAACATPGVIHWSQALRLTDLKGLSFPRVFSALPERARQTIRETFTARRHAQIEVRKLVNQVQGQMRRLVAADAAKSRKLMRLAEFVYRRPASRTVESTCQGGKAPIQRSGAIFNGILKGVANVS